MSRRRRGKSVRGTAPRERKRGLRARGQRGSVSSGLRSPSGGSVYLDKRTGYLI